LLRRLLGQIGLDTQLRFRNFPGRLGFLSFSRPCDRVIRRRFYGFATLAVVGYLVGSGSRCGSIRILIAAPEFTTGERDAQQ
jgi:hypothetical protein